MSVKKLEEAMEEIDFLYAEIDLMEELINEKKEKIRELEAEIYG